MHQEADGFVLVSHRKKKMPRSRVTRASASEVVTGTGPGVRAFAVDDVDETSVGGALKAVEECRAKLVAESTFFSGT